MTAIGPDEEPVCGCGHNKVRHPFGGACNRAGCGCTRFRQAVADDTVEPIEGAQDAPPEVIPPSSPQPDPERPIEIQPPGADVHVDGALTAVSAAYLPDSSEIQHPEADPPVGGGGQQVVAGTRDPIEKRIQAYRDALRSSSKPLRALADKATAVLNDIVDEADLFGQRAQLEQELARLETRRGELMAALGKRPRGRPPRT